MSLISLSHSRPPQFMQSNITHLVTTLSNHVLAETLIRSVVLARVKEYFRNKSGFQTRAVTHTPVHRGNTVAEARDGISVPSYPCAQG